MTYRFSLVFFIFSITITCLLSQSDGPSHQDSLRGMLRQERTCFDVHHYGLHVKVQPKAKSIKGSVEISMDILDKCELIQLDLYENMRIDSIHWKGKNLSYHREGRAVWVETPNWPDTGKQTIVVFYGGKPISAANAPWDGGFVWQQDSQGKPWVGVACEGDGASLWWPLKDHLSDEPDSMDISITAPKDLMSVSNGELMARECNESSCTYYWKVGYSINSYNVTVNIGDYVHFQDQYQSPTAGKLNLDYYVLRENEQTARLHFEQVPGVLEAFEYWYGPYPFWEDGYALVETPYLGMEHQGAIAYGNKYMRGYLGRLSPESLNFDYIIVHETGHEYWGNSVSCDDHAEMWIHEAFTTYMEALYVEYHHGFDIATEYLESQRPYIRNLAPVVGPRDINYTDFGSSDHYYKGSWILHTFRQLVAEDEAQWRGFLRAIYERYEHSVTRTTDILDYINEYYGEDYSWFWDQYLYQSDLPTWVFSLADDVDSDDEGVLRIKHSWQNSIPDFAMPFFFDDVVSHAEPQVTIVKMTREAFAERLSELQKLYLIEIREEPWDSH